LSKLSIAIPDASALIHITSVHLRLRGEQDARTAASVITSIPGIVDLAVHAENHWKGGMTRDSNYAELVFATSTATHRFPHLKTLVLKGMCFDPFLEYDFGSTLANVVEFERLDQLQLVDCSGAERLLVYLGTLQTAFATLHIEDSHMLFPDEGESSACFLSIAPTQELFLSHFSAVACGWKDDWTTLTTHAGSLRSLRVNLTSPSWTAPDMLRFLTFCQSSSNLQRLAVNGPDIEECFWASAHGFLAWLVSIYAFALLL
jgi:hypothetical protein